MESLLLISVGFGSEGIHFQSLDTFLAFPTVSCISVFYPLDIFVLSLSENGEFVVCVKYLLCEGLLQMSCDEAFGFIAFLFRPWFLVGSYL